jgi:hypothetical protein
MSNFILEDVVCNLTQGPCIVSLSETIVCGVALAELQRNADAAANRFAILHGSACQQQE